MDALEQFNRIGLLHSRKQRFLLMTVDRMQVRRWHTSGRTTHREAIRKQALETVAPFLMWMRNMNCDGSMKMFE